MEGNPDPSGNVSETAHLIAPTAYCVLKVVVSKLLVSD